MDEKFFDVTKDTDGYTTRTMSGMGCKSLVAAIADVIGWDTLPGNLGDQDDVLEWLVHTNTETGDGPVFPNVVWMTWVVHTDKQNVLRSAYYSEGNWLVS